MREIKVSDSSHNEAGVAYIYGALSGALSDLNGNIYADTDDVRSTIKIEVANAYGDYVKSEVEDKIADVIAVRYKYFFFKKFIKVGGLTPLETEMLFCALIAADIDDDKKYIMRKLRPFGEYSIDGVFNFRLSPLKKKWADIVGYIPSFFSSEKFTDFVSYLVGEKSGKTVTVENGKVYDKHFNVFKRTELTGDMEEGRIAREVILSACGDVRLLSPLPPTDERYIKRFFSGRISGN